MAALVLVVVGLFCVLPVARLLWAAAEVFGDGAAMELLGSSTLRRATVNTLLIAAGSTAFALVYGVAVALVLGTMRLRTGRALGFVFVLSLMVAPQVLALAFKTLAGPASPILNSVGLAPPPGTRNPMLSLGGIVLVMGLHHAPLVAVTVAAGLSRVPQTLIQAAMLDGAGLGRLVSQIVLPVIRLHLLAAAMLCFVAGVGNFGIPALLGLPAGIVTLPTLVFRELASFGRGGINDAALVSLVIVAITGAAVIASAWLMSTRDVRIAGGEAMAPFVRHKPLKLACEAGLWAVFGVTIVLPALSLLATALVPAYGVVLDWETVTVAQFTDVLLSQALVRRAFANSFVFAGSAAVAVAVLSLLIAYVLDRRLARFKPLVLTLVELPYALPGVVIAIAAILLFARPIPLLGINLYGTAWVIVFAYLASFLAIALKPVLASMSSLEREVEEAAVMDGAGVWRRVRQVLGPLLVPATCAGGMMAFLLAFNELTISALLWSAGTETIGVALLNLEDAGLGAEAAALAVAATAVIALLMAFMEALSSRLPAQALPWHNLGGAG